MPPRRHAITRATCPRMCVASAQLWAQPSFGRLYTLLGAEARAGNAKWPLSGELILNVPCGYLKLPNGEVVLDPDEQARSTVQLVFDQFDALGGAAARSATRGGRDISRFSSVAIRPCAVRRSSTRSTWSELQLFSCIRSLPWAPRGRSSSEGRWSWCARSSNRGPGKAA